MPLSCGFKIENCSVYTHYEITWICEESNQGYTKSDAGQCDQFQAGYLDVANDSLLCRNESLSCILYDIISDESIFKLREIGHSLNSNSQCTNFETGYVSVSLSASRCVREVSHYLLLLFIGSSLWDCSFILMFLVDLRITIRNIYLLLCSVYIA